MQSQSVDSHGGHMEDINHMRVFIGLGVVVFYFAVWCMAKASSWKTPLEKGEPYNGKSPSSDAGPEKLLGDTEPLEQPHLGGEFNRLLFTYGQIPDRRKQVRPIDSDVYKRD